MTKCDENTGVSIMRELQVHSLQLVGGQRELTFNLGFSVVQGTITSGKTTLVRLIKGMLGRIPTHLPPETGVIRNLRARIQLASETWILDRPLVTTNTAIVTLSRREATDPLACSSYDLTREDVIVDAIRLPAISPTASEQQTYRSWILRKLGIPEVSVPQARTDATSPPTPVTISDWLLYCIVRDDELDTAVFGHNDSFVDRKRRAVFELNYGLYDSDVAKLEAELRSIELQLDDIDRTNEAVRNFLQGTPMSSLDDIDRDLETARSSLERLNIRSAELADTAHESSASLALRQEITVAELALSTLTQELSATRKHLQDLRDLNGALKAQSQRYTRAIVAGEWLVDFDFVVCPRCGSSVEDSRSDPHHCYLCLQQPQMGDFHGQLVSEQERIASQIVETEELVVNRSAEVAELERRVEESRRTIDDRNLELDRRTAEFVSRHTDTIASAERERARLEAELQRLNEYRRLFVRFTDLGGLRVNLEEQRADLTAALAARAALSERSERLLRDLEDRFLEYLRRLNVSLSDLPLTVAINRKTYMPEISGRRFDELSSQGLTVLVNVAHALAHHTVSIDHQLPLPGLLVLDGLSSNVGHEGFDRDRRDDTYRLLMQEVEKYRGTLQVIALDNDVPNFATDSIVSTLTTEDRLVRLTDEADRNGGAMAVT